MATQYIPSKPGPASTLESPPKVGEVFMIKLLLDMPLFDTTNPITWTEATGKTVAHPCVLLANALPDRPSGCCLEVLVIRSFNSRATIQASGNSHLLGS